MRAGWDVGRTERKGRMRRRMIHSVIWTVNLTMILEAVLLLLFWKTPEQVESIHITHASWDGSVHYTEMLIDVENELYYEYNMPQYWLERDPDAENNGYQIVKELERDKLDYFFRAASRWGFWGWGGWYENRNVCDGDTWEIVVTYNGGSTGQAGGYVRKPPKWRNVSDAYLRMTGHWM